jgi:predicted TIM-barrel fold metal-dependent hydrolase
MKPSIALAAVLLFAACAMPPATDPAASETQSVAQIEVQRQAPRIDYHQHLVSPAFAPIVNVPAGRDGAALVKELDAAGVKRAVVLSVGYSFADERKAFANPDEMTRAENDYTSAEVMKSAARLIGFCSANPLRPVALTELERCLALPGMFGIKLHLGNAGITLRDPTHLARMQEVFALAQRRGAPVLIHMRARGGTNYGAEDARIFLDEIVPRARDIEIVIAHLGASGPGYSGQHDEVMAVFGAAAESGDWRMRNIYFDVSSNVTNDITSADAALVARGIRQVGLQRVLYGSDLSAAGGSIGKAWEIFRTKLPLTSDEVAQIANNETLFASCPCPRPAKTCGALAEKTTPNLANAQAAPLNGVFVVLDEGVKDWDFALKQLACAGIRHVIIQSVMFDTAQAKALLHAAGKQSAVKVYVGLNYGSFGPSALGDDDKIAAMVSKWPDEVKKGIGGWYIAHELYNVQGWISDQASADDPLKQTWLLAAEINKYLAATSARVRKMKKADVLISPYFSPSPHASQHEEALPQNVQRDGRDASPVAGQHRRAQRAMPHRRMPLVAPGVRDPDAPLHAVREGLKGTGTEFGVNVEAFDISADPPCRATTVAASDFTRQRKLATEAKAQMVVTFSLKHLRELWPTLTSCDPPY